MSKAGFSTPENDRFYRERPYGKLNSERREIRLLRVQRQRMTIFEVQEKWPEWRDRLRPIPCNQKPKEPLESYPYTWPYQPQALPSGWEQFTSSQPKLVKQNFTTYEMHIPWYFNICTGKSQWNPPTESAYSFPKSPLIVCEIIDATPLTSVYGRHTKYATLSYCAGDAGQTTEIIVNGLIFNAFSNLEHSLECVRLYWTQHSSEDLLIWTDQVCISQSDHIEKSNQVDMMGEIFKRCWQTFACLSTASTSAQLSTASFSSYPSPYARAMYRQLGPQYSFSSYPFSYARAASPPPDLQILRNYLANKWPREVPRETLQQESSGDTDKIDYSDQSILSSIWQGLRLISDIVAAPWWTRAWAFQEVILPSRVSVLYHGLCARWPDLSPLVSCFCKNRDAIIQDLNDLAKERVEKERVEIQRVEKERRDRQSRRRSAFGLLFSKVEGIPRTASDYFYPAFSPMHLDSGLVKSDLARALYTVSAKTNWHGSYDLTMIAENMHKFSAKDPRDLVYAFIGLIGPEWDIKSDYSPHITLHHVLVTITRLLIQHWNHLNILVDALRRSGEFAFQLPSWVPDWTVPRSSAMQPPPELRDSMRKFRASKSTKADASFFAHQGEKLYVHLEVTGIEADTLSQIEHDTYGDEQYFRSVRGRRIFTSASAKVDDTVWVIHGADPVFVLRHEKHDCYVLISTAFVIDPGEPARFSPIMDGELIDREDRGEVTCRSIRII